MTAAKSNVFNFIWIELNFGGEGGGEGANFWLVGCGTPPVPLVGKTFYIYINIYKRTLATGFYIQ